MGREFQIKFVTIMTEPRGGGVTVRGWNITTSEFGHKSCTGGQLHKKNMNIRDGAVSVGEDKVDVYIF